MGSGSACMERTGTSRSCPSPGQIEGNAIRTRDHPRERSACRWRMQLPLAIERPRRTLALYLIDAYASMNGMPRALHGWSQPQRRPGGFHGPVDHSKKLGREGVQVHFVAEAGAEGLDRPGRVVATPVEAPV